MICSSLSEGKARLWAAVFAMFTEAGCGGWINVQGCRRWDRFKWWVHNTFFSLAHQGAGGEAETQVQRLSRSNVQELVLHEVVAPLILGAEIDEHVYATDAALSKAVVSTHLPDVAKPLWLRGGLKKSRLHKACWDWWRGRWGFTFHGFFVFSCGPAVGSHLFRGLQPGGFAAPIWYLGFTYGEGRKCPKGHQTGFAVTTFPNDSDTTSFKRQIVRLRT